MDGNIGRDSLTLSVLSSFAQDYCASKFGVVGFHESLSHELKAAEKDGINTTLVCPYLVDTGMFRGCRIRSVGTHLLLIQQSNIRMMCGAHLQSASLAHELSVDTLTALAKCGSTHLESIALLGAGAGAGKLSQVENQTSLQDEF